MSTTTPPTPSLNPTDLQSFHSALSQSTRVLALLGAGLSASSGLPTFRGAGGLWRTHDATSLATPEAFEANPGLVWQFYSYRRHMALQVQPNAAHYALAELAKKMPGFLTLSQNVDGLSQRASHPPAQLQLLHGTLFSVHCTDRARCRYGPEPNFVDPIVPSLAIPTSTSASGSGAVDTTSNATRQQHQDLDISSITIPLQTLHPHDLPICPKCTTNLLRPSVVWFGERLPSAVLNSVDAYIAHDSPIDLIMVIGTSAKVFPAAGYIEEAREKGARVCVVNTDVRDEPPGGWREGDWFFGGDAAVIVPQLLEPVIGKGSAPGIDV